MTAEGLLRTLAIALTEQEIPFMLTGSVASAYHGAGRATMDVDLVIDPLPNQLETFVARVVEMGLYVLRWVETLGLDEQWSAAGAPGR